MTQDYPTPERVISIHAHPDDQEFSAAGALARWVQAGSYAVSVIVTDGDAGSNDPSMNSASKPELARLRREEQLEANQLLGIQETVFLGYPDGVLQPTLELRRDLTRLLRKYKPDILIAGDPTVRFYGNDYINHPDHRAAADAALDAAFPSSGTRLIFPELLDEGLEPHDLKAVFLHGSEKNDTWIDISGVIEVKLQALLAHRSQLGQDAAKMVREWAVNEGKQIDVAYAEAYRVMKLG